MENSNPRPTIVLVHGAWADASGWQEVIPAFLDAGYNVKAVQLPLTNVIADITTAQRLVDAQTAPVIVVAHSYGGAVTSALNNAKGNIAALVFISAITPDNGETVQALFNKYPPTPMLSNITPDAAGMLYIIPEKFPEIFAQDVDRKMARIMAVTQKPVNAGGFPEVFKAQPIWKTVPSWFLVTKRDNVVSPELQRFFAKRMNAKTTEVDASHASFISQPQETIKIVMEAVRTVEAGPTGRTVTATA